MGSRYASHQLGNGLFVSGRPEQPKERPPTMTSVAMPYTGGDIKKSGELGKMFEIPNDGTKSRKSGPISGAPSRSGSFTQSGPGSAPISAGRMSGSLASAGSVSMKKTNSGPLSKHGEPLKKSSGPQSGGGTRQNSGPIPVLPATGLITSGPLNSSGAPRKVSGPLDTSGSFKTHHVPSVVHNRAVTTLGPPDDFSSLKSFPKPVLWLIALIFVMGFLAGGFIFGAVHNPMLLIIVAVFFAVVASLFIWNICWGRRAVTDFIARYPDADLRTAKNGQYVKVTGVVTCGNVPLESSYQRVPRCVYTSTCLNEYRGWGSKPANSSHRSFTWGLRSSERHVVDFYISDFQSGLRALVKTGHGAKVTPLVDDAAVMDFKHGSEQMSPDFVQWLKKKNLSSDDRIMRLKEGYIKEGSTVSVIGVVQRNDNVLMIVPSSEPIAAGWQWRRFTFPTTLEGVVLRCEDSSNVDAIPV